MEEGARDVEGTLFRATQPCRVAGLRLSARAVTLMQEKPQEVRVTTDENGGASGQTHEVGECWVPAFPYRQ